MDRRGFILAQEITHASEVEAGPALGLLSNLPMPIQSLAADTGYSRGKLRQALAQHHIQAFIPMHPRQLSYRIHNEGFTYHGDHLVCPEGKILKRSHFNVKDECWFYAAKQKDCQACAVKERCLAPKSKRRFVQLTQYHREFQAALKTMNTARFKRAMRTRKTVVEGVFAHLDRMAFSKVKRRGLHRVRSEGFLVAFAYNVLKMVTLGAKPRSGALANTFTDLTIAGTWILSAM